MTIQSKDILKGKFFYAVILSGEEKELACACEAVLKVKYEKISKQEK